MGLRDTRLLFVFLAALTLVLPSSAQTQNTVTTSWPNGDRFSGPAYDGDLETIAHGTWTFADGSQLVVDSNGAFYRDTKGEPVTDGAFLKARPRTFVPLVRGEDWPAGALQRGEAGLTILVFVVDDDNKVRDIRVVQSSGYDDLDQQAVKLLSKQVFLAATQGRERIKSSLSQPYRWKADLTALARIPRIAKPTSPALDMSGNSPNWVHAANTDCWMRNPLAAKPANLTVNWTGGCTANIASGSGTMTWATGTHVVETYTGDVKDGFYSGRGSWRYEDGSHYEGDFVGGLHTGTGVYTNAENVRYEGGFKDDGFNGPGRLRLAGGPLLEGVFVDDNLTTGTETFGAGIKYEGTFANFQPAGKGRIRYSNGEYFEGEFATSSRSLTPLFILAPLPGRGQYHYPNGIVDDGIKVAGIFSGTRILADGTRLENFIWAHRDPKSSMRTFQGVPSLSSFVTAELEMTVGVDGKIRDVHIIKSSGNDVQDDRIISFMESDDSYLPATTDGKPIESWRHINFLATPYPALFNL